MLIASQKVFMGKPIWLVCDGDCEHAWGINWRRPRGDTAPANPGTYEGGDGKPIDRRHNKWCARECERCAILSRGNRPDDQDLVLCAPEMEPGAPMEHETEGEK